MVKVVNNPSNYKHECIQYINEENQGSYSSGVLSNLRRNYILFSAGFLSLPVSQGIHLPYSHAYSKLYIRCIPKGQGYTEKSSIASVHKKRDSVKNMFFTTKTKFTFLRILLTFRRSDPSNIGHQKRTNPKLTNDFFENF